MSRRVAISLTHVEYVEGDRIGYVLAWCSLFPIFLLISFITLIAIRRDLCTIFYFIGLVLNEGFNFVLKHIIKEPRPDSDLYSSNLFVEYGMPSSHAQFMAFFAVYFTLFIFIRTTLSEGVMDITLKAITSAGTIGGACLCSFSRYYLGYHTSSQIIFGIVFGIFMACIWFACVQMFIAPYFPWIYFWKVNDKLLIKDFSLIPNILWFEFTSAKYESRTRSKRKSSIN